jgi:lipoprotein-anchoring transpeptidase ErfK/SrfK
MTSVSLSIQQTLNLARQALQQSERYQARQLAFLALRQNPECEEAWLILAAVAGPHAAQYYLERALQINPASSRSRQGISWNIQRIKTVHFVKQRPTEIKGLTPADASSPSVRMVPLQALVARRTAIAPWIITIFIISIGLISWIGMPFSLPAQAQSETGRQLANLVKPTLTPSSTPTFTPSPIPTTTPLPTETPLPAANPETDDQTNASPALKGAQGHWLDVNLSEQRLYAYNGDQLVQSFIVSTGTWLTPTITGQYYIYVKYLYADMAGPGYYLPNVPYVMYFYSGYGIHGTYWHNNFGTPMSHGCINLAPEEAAWIYEFSSVGTLVNIHY